MNQTPICLKQQAQGFVQCFVVDAATGKVVKEYPRQKNLILNQGMDQLVTNLWAELFAYCSAGNGVTPTSDDSGLTTATQSGTAVTLAGGAFTFTSTLVDGGNMIKWDTGEEAMIVSVTTPTTLVVDRSATVGAGQFTVYRTNQTTLASQLKRTSTYLTGSPYCGSTLTSNVLNMQRTFDFTAEVATVNYTEAAFGWSSTGANTLFSRVLLASPVPVNAGQQLRVTYQLQIVVVPNVAFTKTAVVGGWPVAPAVNTDGTEAVQFLGLSSVNTSGSSTQFDGGIYGNEPSSNSTGVFLSVDATAPAAFGSAVTRSALTEASTTRAAYIPGTWYVDKTATFAVGAGNSTGIRSMGAGTFVPGVYHAYSNTTVVFVFDQAQTKLNTHTLTLTWRFSWNRVLS